MAKQSRDMEGRVPFYVSTAQRPDFNHSLAIYAFDARGEPIHRAEITDGKVELPLSPRALYKARVFIAPVDAKTNQADLTAERLQRLGAYEPVLHIGDKLVDRIDIPGSIIDLLLLGAGQGRPQQRQPRRVQRARPYLRSRPDPVVDPESRRFEHLQAAR